MPKESPPVSTMDFPVINPNAAGADIGAERIFLAVPPDRSKEEVRIFATFTQDLNDAAQWLVDCGITTVAVESTSVYWIPFTQIVESRGIQICLVNPRQVKNVPAAFKTDRRDSKWLRNLHAVGLLSSSFRPDQQVCAVRSIARHRNNLTKQASKCILHMQKALSQMNILVHEVLSDITGQSGMAIMTAILDGHRDPGYLARLCNGRVKASQDQIKKALVGDWREEHLFTLRQSLESWRHFQAQIAACDKEIDHLMSAFEHDDNQPPSDQTPSLPSGPLASRKRKTAKAQDDQKRRQLTNIFGVDLTLIPGISVNTAEFLFTEVGADLSRFPSKDHFASWLGLAPNNRESGGKILSRKTRRTNNRLAAQLRLSANTLTRSDNYLGAYLRRMKSRLGAPKGITATARKLATIIYTLATTRNPYDESIFAEQQQRFRQKRLDFLIKEASALGYDFVQRQFVS